ncbi:MAG: hypothetical protein ACYCPQ_10530 [Elusimicrobiota bacterium]
MQTMGSLFLLIICIWFYYSTRREWRSIEIIGKTIFTHTQKDSHLKSFAFYSLAQHSVFAPVFSSPKESREQRGLSRSIVRALIFIPAWVSALFCISDIYSLLIPHLLSTSPHITLWREIIDDPNKWKTAGEIFEIIVREGICIIITCICYVFCTDIEKWAEKTTNKIGAMGRIVMGKTGKNKMKLASADKILFSYAVSQRIAKLIINRLPKNG